MEYMPIIFIVLFGAIIFSIFQIRKAYAVQREAQRRFAEVARHWLVYFETHLQRSLHDSELFQCLYCVLNGYPEDLVEESWVYLEDSISLDENLPKKILWFMVNSEIINDDEYANLLTTISRSGFILKK